MFSESFQRPPLRGSGHKMVVCANVDNIFWTISAACFLIGLIMDCCIFVLLLLHLAFSFLNFFYLFEINHFSPLHVCLSARPTIKCVDCDKTEEISVQIFIPYKRSRSLVFWEEEWLVGGGDPLLPESLGHPAPIEATLPILNQYLLAASRP